MSLQHEPRTKSYSYVGICQARKNWLDCGAFFYVLLSLLVPPAAGLQLGRFHQSHKIVDKKLGPAIFVDAASAVAIDGFVEFLSNSREFVERMRRQSGARFAIGNRGTR